jgi:hypothetical protein
MYTFCYVRSALVILFHCGVLCIVCVKMFIMLLPMCVSTPAVKKYIVSYQINVIIGICHRLNPSGRSMALGSSDCLTESGTSDIP